MSRATSKALRVAVLMLTPVLFLLFTTAGSANASWRNGALYNQESGRCLDAGPGHLQQYSCNGTAAQRFTDISSTQYYQLQNGLGQCIDSGQIYVSGLFPCNGGDYQLWSVAYVGKDAAGRSYYQFRNVHWSDICLDSGQNYNTDIWGNPTNGYQMGPCNSGTYQWFSWN